LLAHLLIARIPPLLRAHSGAFISEQSFSRPVNEASETDNL
jgi:hypothetical protein